MHLSFSSKDFRSRICSAKNILDVQEDSKGSNNKNYYDGISTNIAILQYDVTITILQSKFCEQV